MLCPAISDKPTAEREALFNMSQLSSDHFTSDGHGGRLVRS